MYASGQGVAKNLHIARHWFKKAAADGKGKQQQLALTGECQVDYIIGDVYFNNHHFTKAYVFFKKSADMGFPPAENALGNYYATFHYPDLAGTPPSLPPQKLKRLLQGAAQGLRAFHQLQSAAHNGDLTAMYYLGILYDHRFMPNRAQTWLTKASIRGDAKAQYVLAMLWFQGAGGMVILDPGMPVISRFRNARMWMTQSASKGYSKAEAELV